MGRDLSDEMGVDMAFIQAVKEYYKIADQARNDQADLI